MRIPIRTAVFCCLLGSFVQAEPAIHPDEAVQQLDWHVARSVVGQMAFVSGKIVNVHRVGRVNFLNFDTQRPARFTGIVFRENLENFPESLKETYLNKIVRIRGTVSLYRDQPQIVISRADQIEILDAMPPTTEPLKRTGQLSRPGELKIATYNLLNLFDSEDDPYHADEGTPAKPREELQHVAQSISALNADVIAFQEIESRGYLRRFVDVFFPELGYEHIVHFEGNDVRGIDVCLISRVPVGPVRSYRHLTFSGPDGSRRSFSRDVLAVTIEPLEGLPLEVWVVHLKSNSGGRKFSEPVRLAEARQLRELLEQQLESAPDSRVIVLGDFNDTWESKTMKTIVGEGATALWSAASDSSQKGVVTYNTGKYRSMIDFILCSPSMAKQYVKGSFQVEPGSPQSTGSDHNPVAVRFRLR